MEDCCASAVLCGFSCVGVLFDGTASNGLLRSFEGVDVVPAGAAAAADLTAVFFLEKKKGFLDWVGDELDETGIEAEFEICSNGFLCSLLGERGAMDVDIEGRFVLLFLSGETVVAADFVFRLLAESISLPLSSLLALLWLNAA